MGKKGGKQNPLFVKADLLAKKVYEVSHSLPKHERYGLTSQIRRAGLSVILNVVEGFARQSQAENRRFLFIAFGSLKETKYLLYFSKHQNYINDEGYKDVLSVAEEVAKIIWKATH